MAKGPAPTPTKVRVLHGERAYRTRRVEPQPRAGEVVAPGWMPQEARGEWDRALAELTPTGVLTPADADLPTDATSVSLMAKAAAVAPGGCPAYRPPRPTTNGWSC